MMEHRRPAGGRAERTLGGRKLKVAGLFAGIGGVELGFARAGHETVLLSENDAGASAVLRERFPLVPNCGDVRDLSEIPAGIDLVTAGFPCQDLSQAGETRGIRGRNSGLVGEVFRLLAERPVPWVLLENVPFMLQLRKGAGIRLVADELERLGYTWAYRVIDANAFGVPQRRERVFLLASLADDPVSVLFADEAGPPLPMSHHGRPCGFYWTEGTRGLGWAIDAVPTLKGGSTIGIPSPPAVWMPDGRIVKPSIRAGERLQGFDADWTLPAETVARRSQRWKLVGNAVSVDTAEWIGRCLAKHSSDVEPLIAGYLPRKGSWPKSGVGGADSRLAVKISTWPVRYPAESLAEYLDGEAELLSYRATAGFVSRLMKGSLRYPDEFRVALGEHLARMAGPTTDAE